MQFYFSLAVATCRCFLSTGVKHTSRNSCKILGQGMHFIVKYYPANNLIEITLRLR